MFIMKLITQSLERALINLEILQITTHKNKDSLDGQTIFTSGLRKQIKMIQNYDFVRNEIICCVLSLQKILELNH